MCMGACRAELRDAARGLRNNLQAVLEIALPAPTHRDASRCESSRAAPRTAVWDVCIFPHRLALVTLLGC